MDNWTYIKMIYILIYIKMIYIDTYISNQTCNFSGKEGRCTSGGWRKSQIMAKILDDILCIKYIKYIRQYDVYIIYQIMAKGSWADDFENGRGQMDELSIRITVKVTRWKLWPRWCCRGGVVACQWGGEVAREGEACRQLPTFLIKLDSVGGVCELLHSLILAQTLEKVTVNFWLSYKGCFWF